MTRYFLFLFTLFAVAICLGRPYDNQSSAPRGARINNLKILSNNIDDVTTAENIVKSFAKPGMTDAERSKALWTAAVRYRHQSVPPNEFLAEDWEAHDPVKLFNVYGYCMCCCCSSLIESLNRLDGREARGRILNGHSVPEVQYGGGWHMYDCSLITLFPKPDNSIASVDEISDAVRAWYETNPAYKGNPSKLVEIMRSEGWTGWKSKGPPLLANCPYYSSGYLPARTHGWDATMQEYNRKSEVYEYGYQVGHRALFSLRPGESFVREAGNHGLHVNMESEPKWDGLKAKAPEADLAYLRDFMPGYTGGVVGNGYHRYTPDIASGGLELGAESFENLESGRSLHPTYIKKPGIAVIRMESPYVYLGGRVKLSAQRVSGKDPIALYISTNNGHDYVPIWTADTTGPMNVEIDLKSRIFRRYAYWLMLEINSTTPSGAGVSSISIENDIQHAPRTLPWLGKGVNKITVAADRDTAIATRTVSCRITPDRVFAKNETSASMGVKFDNVDVKDGSCWWKGGVGTVTVPIETPGDLSALRFGAHIRARGAKDVVKMLLSFDDGKTWSDAAKISGPTAATTQYFNYSTIPAGARKALLRYELTGNNTIGVFSFRVDADYRDPLAAFRPFNVTYRWKENGMEKSKAITVDKLPTTFGIQTDAAPEMVSVSCQMPPK